MGGSEPSEKGKKACGLGFKKNERREEKEEENGCEA